MPVVLKTFEEFCTEQDCDYILLNPYSDIPGTKHYLFANGAQSNGQHRHAEPPTDQNELTKLRLRYLRKKLDSTIRRYRQDREAIAQQVKYRQLGAGPLPGNGWEAHLQGLAKTIEAMQTELKTLEQTLPDHDAGLERNQRRAEEKARANDTINRLNEFPVF